MIPESLILKTDTRGRVRTPVAQREGLLDAFERSGLSGMKFAALHGVKYPSFAGWVQKRKRRRQLDSMGLAAAGAATASREADSGGALRWWEAVVGEEAGRGGDNGGHGGNGVLRGGLLLHLPGGLRTQRIRLIIEELFDTHKIGCNVSRAFLPCRIKVLQNDEKSLPVSTLPSRGISHDKSVFGLGLSFWG